MDSVRVLRKSALQLERRANITSKVYVHGQGMMVPYHILREHHTWLLQ